MFLGVARSKVPPKQNQPVGEARATTKEEPLPVCVVDQNRLAARYLLEVLAKNPAFRAVTLEEMVALKPSERIIPVFIIDMEGIDLPLSECLHVLRERYPNAKFVVGGWWSGGPLSINGKMDNVRLYNRELSADEIAILSQYYQPTTNSIRQVVSH